MKRPDRTFTNLSKVKVEQSHMYREFMMHGGNAASRGMITSPSSQMSRVNLNSRI